MAQGLFACKKARPDVQPTMSVLCTRVKTPGQKDCGTFLRPTKHSHATVNCVLTLNARKGVNNVEQSVDLAFRVHPDFKSHVGGTMTFKGGKESVINTSAKQTLNMESSTAAESVDADYTLPLTLWIPSFLKE